MSDLTPDPPHDPRLRLPEEPVPSGAAVDDLYAHIAKVQGDRKPPLTLVGGGETFEKHLLELYLDFIARRMRGEA